MPGRGRLSVSPLSALGWRLEEDLDLTRSLGLTRTSVALAKLDLGGRSEGLARLARSGLAVDVVYPGAGFDLADPGTFAATRARVADGLEVAGRLGATAVMVNGAGRGLPYEAARAAFADALAPLRSRAADLGVRLSVEPVRTQFAYAGFVHTLGDGVDLARELELGLVVDVTHCWWEPDLDRRLAAAAPLADTVHLADLRLDGPVLSRCVPGDGDLPLGPFMARLLEAGYSGPFEVELTGPVLDDEGAAAALTRSIEVVDGLLGPAGG